MKEIKDYLHLYLGCQLVCISNASNDYEYNGRKTKLTPMRLSTNVYNDTSIWRLALRPLSSMTEEEAKTLHLIEFDFTPEENTHWIVRQLELISPKTFLFLLSKHFDLFGLIESGLAVDATTLTHQT